MESEIDAFLEKREKIRKKRPTQLLITAFIWFALIILEFFSDQLSNLAPIFACVFAATLLSYYAAKVSKLNLELIEKLNDVEHRLGEMEGKKS